MLDVFEDDRAVRASPENADPRMAGATTRDSVGHKGLTAIFALLGPQLKPSIIWLHDQCHPDLGGEDQRVGAETVGFDREPVDHHRLALLILGRKPHLAHLCAVS